VAHKLRKRSSPIIKVVNKATGKESTGSTDFNHANWGAIMSDYIQSIKNSLSPISKFDAIIAKAKSFTKVNNHGGNMVAASTIPKEKLDGHAQLCDDDSDDE
jgi:hypothetical protein